MPATRPASTSRVIAGVTHGGVSSPSVGSVTGRSVSPADATYQTTRSCAPSSPIASAALPSSARASLVKTPSASMAVTEPLPSRPYASPSG